MRNGAVVGRAVVFTEFDVDDAARMVRDQLLHEADITQSDLSFSAATGIGRDLVPWVSGSLNETISAARGARFLCPETEMVLDIGAESCRVILLRPDGSVFKYEVNDKCASGAGTFIETMARALQIPVEEMGAYSLRHDKELTTDAQCVVFAESEVISLIHRRERAENIAYGIHMGIAKRILSLIRRVGSSDQITVVGGPGHNLGLLDCMRRSYGCKVVTPDDTDYANAIGAALFAAEQTNN